jgi:hypothetical protein
MKFTGQLPTTTINTQKTIHNGHWLFPNQMGDPAYVGFIYLIRDNYLKRFYLGKKLYYGSGNMNKGKESNWKSYITSSKFFKEVFIQRPKEEFDFICLEQYKTRGTLSYAETWTLCFVEAPTNKNWYNTRIEQVSWSVKEPITDRHKQRLKDALNFKQMEIK